MTPTHKLPFRNFKLFTLSIILLAGLLIVSLPHKAFAEPAWWTQQKIDCGLSPSLAYNDWVAQGSPCNRGGSSGGSGGLSPGTQIGNALGDAAVKMLFGDPAEEARDRAAAQQQAYAQQQAAELAAQRAAEAAAAAARKKQADYSRLRGMLKLDNFDGDTGGGLVLKGVEVESGGGLARDTDGKLALKFGDDDLQPQVTRASANSGAAVSPAPNTDPMVVDLRGTTKTAVDPDLLKNPSVVDARNEPSGLPKFVEDAIAEAFSTAPPGVADAVRKGYQAIMAHDMNAAQSWFKDALNQHPGDAGLTRLVDLTSYTLQREREIAAGQTPAAAVTAPANPSSKLTLEQGKALTDAYLEQAMNAQLGLTAPQAKTAAVTTPANPASKLTLEQGMALTDAYSEQAMTAQLGLATPQTKAAAQPDDQAQMEHIMARKKAFNEKYKEVKAGSPEEAQAEKEKQEIKVEVEALLNK